MGACMGTFTDLHVYWKKHKIHTDIDNGYVINAQKQTPISTCTNTGTDADIGKEGKRDFH
jgi:hypothetical protein